MLQLVNGEHLPDLGVGTWTLRGDTAAANESAALKAGFRLIDTAQMYGNEAEVGRGLALSGLPRSSYMVTTKVRSIRVCNFNPHHLEDLLAYARIKSVMNQIELHPLHSSQQEPEIQRK